MTITKWPVLDGTKLVWFSRNLQGRPDILLRRENHGRARTPGNSSLGPTECDRIRGAQSTNPILEDVGECEIQN